MRVYLIDWFGPYSYNECRKYPKELKFGLYAISGIYYHEQYNKLQYIGITEKSLIERFESDPSHHVHSVTRNRKIWYGKIVKRQNISRYDLELVEWAVVHFSEPSKNSKKTFTPPPESCILISTFYNKTTIFEEEKKPSRRRSIQSIPQLVYWDSNAQILKAATEVATYFTENSRKDRA